MSPAVAGGHEVSVITALGNPCCLQAKTEDTCPGILGHLRP